MPRRTSPRRVAIVCFVAVFLVAGYGLARLAMRDRPDVTAVATPPPIHDAVAIELVRGQEACQADVALDPSSRVVRYYSASPTPEVPRLRVTARGDGWSTTALSPERTDRPGGGADGVYDTRIEPPPRSLLATVCVSTAEKRPAILAASAEERIRSRAPTRIDGRDSDARLGLVVLAGGPRSPLSHARAVLERSAAFDPPPVGWLSLGLLLAIVGVAVPAAAVYAALRALRDDERG